MNGMVTVISIQILVASAGVGLAMGRVWRVQLCFHWRRVFRFGKTNQRKLCKSYDAQIR